jgi:hypothetical protein
MGTFVAVAFHSVAESMYSIASMGGRPPEKISTKEGMNSVFT